MALELRSASHQQKVGVSEITGFINERVSRGEKAAAAGQGYHSSHNEGRGNQQMLKNSNRITNANRPGIWHLSHSLVT